MVTQLNGSDFDIYSQPALNNPWDYFGALRNVEPVFWSDIQNSWIVSRHADVKAGFRDTRLSTERAGEVLSSEAYKEQVPRYPLVYKHMPVTINNLSPENHARIRPLFAKGFSFPVVKRMRETTADVVAQVVESCLRQKSFDFVPLSYRLPSIVTSRILGLPDDKCDELYNLARVFVHFQGSATPTAHVMELLEGELENSVALFEGLISSIKASDTDREDNLIHALLSAQIDQNRLSHDEVVTACIAVVAGGFDTTASASSILIRWLAERPELVEFLRSSPENAEELVVEMLRYPGLSISQMRVANETFVWHGKTITRGDIVYLAIASANTDPRVFEDPREIRPGRKNLHDSMSFGHGAHLCLGQMLAKMELGRLIEQIFLACDVVVEQQEFECIEMYSLQQYSSLQLTFSPRC